MERSIQLTPVIEGLEAYLSRSSVIDFDAPEIASVVERIRRQADSEVERARLAFVFARDEVHHSLDLGGTRRVTVSASDALLHREGICYAKAHLLVALLRGLGIPAGLCYQRLTLGDSPESGFVVHGLVAFLLRGPGRWFRIDPRGNKPGVNAQFDLERERLAFGIRPEIGECDYPWIFAEPPPAVLASLRRSRDSMELLERLPAELEHG